MAKQNEANKANKAQSGAKTTTNPTAMVATYLVVECSRWMRRCSLQIRHRRFSKLRLRKLSKTEKWVLEKVSALETKKPVYVEHGTSLTFRCQNENPAFCRKMRMLRRLLVGCYVWSQSRQYLLPVEKLRKNRINKNIYTHRLLYTLYQFFKNTQHISSSIDII